MCPSFGNFFFFLLQVHSCFPVLHQVAWSVMQGFQVQSLPQNQFSAQLWWSMELCNPQEENCFHHLEPPKHDETSYITVWKTWQIYWLLWHIAQYLSAVAISIGHDYRCPEFVQFCRSTIMLSGMALRCIAYIPSAWRDKQELNFL